MRLISVTLRNCRLHRELKVDFEPSRTLIGGPNETGKSTLIEAVHRALFLKAKGNTEHHRALNSSLHAGHPEVDLAFEAGGHTYLLKKRFGSAGTTSLAPSNAVSLAGDAAESELARLLGVEPGLSGRAIAVQWAHLWVWQGQAGHDPSAHATAQQAGLLQRLQQLGGAAVLQSESDTRVARYFADARARTYTQADKPKAGSEWERAERASLLAREQLARAHERVQKLAAAAADLERASRTLLATGLGLAALEIQQEAAEAKARQLGELNRQALEQSHAAKGAAAAHSLLTAANRQIVAARLGIAELEASLKPQNETLAQEEQASREAQARAAAAEADYRAAIAAVRAARFRHDLAGACAVQFEKSEVHARLSGQEQKVARARAALSGLEQQHAQLPPVDKARLARIQKWELESSNAFAALQAMATGLEVIASDQPVQAGDQAISAGQRQILTEDTEVRIGSAIRFRIQPGGGTSLAAARQTRAEALRQLQFVLDSLGLATVPAALEIHAVREELGARIQAARAELHGMGAENLAAELAAALNELAASRAAVERLAAVVLDVPLPADKAAARSLARSLEKKSSEAEAQEAEAKTARDRLAKAAESAAALLSARQMETGQQRLQLNGLSAQLELLLKTHGEDALRRQALLDSEAAIMAANHLLQATKDAIAALQPELLEGDRVRIARAIKEKTGEQNDAGKLLAVARAALVSDGSQDPAADLALAEAQARAAEAHGRSVQRQAQAVALLDQLFEAEQRSLSAQFTQPLADKISGYLQCLFGAGAHAQVELESNAFSGLRLARPGLGGAPFAFDTLSGGAKEQAAAAVRLAMAEVLAADHGGCLPVVFDDAFAFSDPDRVSQLQRMLDLAAQRGLQVIVLSCNPADYSALGARTVTLRPVSDF